MPPSPSITAANSGSCWGARPRSWPRAASSPKRAPPCDAPSPSETRARELGKDRADTRTLLGKHLLELADINLKLGAYAEASDAALKLPAPSRMATGGRPTSTPRESSRDWWSASEATIMREAVDRDRLSRQYLGRTVVLLREAIDTNPKMADRIKKDPEFKALESRPEYQTMMNTLVDLGQ